MAFRTFRSIANFHAGARCNFNTFKKTFRRITNDHDFGKERERRNNVDCGGESRGDSPLSVNEKVLHICQMQKSSC